MLTSNSLRWLVVVAGAIMLLSVAAACSSETIEVPGETVVVEKEVVKTVEVPGETVTVEVIKEVQVPGETVVVEKVVTETVEVPGETVVVKEEVVKTVEVPGETITVEVVKEVQVPGETVVVEKEVVKTVEVPGETVVVEKEVVKTVEVPGQTVVVEKVVVQEVPGKNYVTDPTTGKVVSAPEYGGTFTLTHPKVSGSFDSVVQGRWASGWHGLVLDKPALADWGRDRDEFALNVPWPTLPYLRGALAESWEQTDDLTIIFNVRKGVYWHNKAPMNGREFTADDIVFNYHRILGLGSGFTEPTPQRTAQLLPLKIESVRATDKYTVVFKLKEPDIRALQGIVEDEVAYMHPPEVIKQHGDTTDWRNLVGTGPYELTDFVEGSSITYTKNPDYWGYDEKYPENRLPYVDQIKMLAMPEVATMLAALRTRKVDAGYNIKSIDQVQSLQKTNPEIQMFTFFTRSNETFGMNVQVPPFGDIRVRKAMQMALDLETANATFFKGWAEMTPYGQARAPGEHVPFEEWPEEVKKVFTYDPEGAEALLDEAGLPRGSDGIRFKTVMTFNQSYNVGYAELSAAYWRDIGVEVELDILPGAVQNQRRGERDYEMMSTESAFLNPPLSQRFYSGFHHNTANPQDPWYDAAYEALAKAKSFAEFQDMTQEMDMYAIEKFWHIWGGMAPQILPIQPWVIGYNGELALGAGNYKLYYSRMWIDSALKEAMGY